MTNIQLSTCRFGFDFSPFSPLFCGKNTCTLLLKNRGSRGRRKQKNCESINEIDFEVELVNGEVK